MKIIKLQFYRSKFIKHVRENIYHLVTPRFIEGGYKLIDVFSKLMILLISFLISSCQTKQPQDIKTAFYHWKTDFNISNIEKQYLDSLKTKKLYLRFFDIDWDETTHFAKPLANISNFKNIDTTFEIIPTIYITNKTFTQLKDNQLDTLSKLVFEKNSEKYFPFP